MGKALGIDYGTKRTGIAITDSLQIIASGLTTISTRSIYNFIDNIIYKENIDYIVVGSPKNLDGSSTECTPHVDRFITRFKKLYPLISVYQIDERYTSKIAKKSILFCGVKKGKRRDKALVDMVSATIILQNYLDFR